MALTHSDIAPAANRGETADAGNLYTFPGPPSRYSGFWSNSWMPQGMADSLDALAAEGIVAEQTIMSFATPIAMRFGDVWIMAETNYSARTSQQIGKLGAGWNRPGLDGVIRRVPGDVNPLELRRVLEKKMRFIPGDRGKTGRYVPAENWVPGC